MIATMATNKRGRGRPSKNLAKFSVKAPASIREAIVALATRHRRPITTEIVIALENHLKAHNALPDGYETPEDPEQ